MKYLVSFLLLFCGLSAFSQADTIFVLGAEFGATTEPTDSTFTVDIVHPTDQLGQAFTASKIQIGYRLIDVFGRLYRVKSVDATGIGSSTLTVVELQDAAGPSGTGLVYRKPDNSDCIPEIQTGDIGISYALAARIANHNAVVGCGGTGGGGSGTVETIVAGTGISVDATDAANPIVTNTAPDQTVAITGEGSVAVTGTYPSFTVTGNADGEWSINADSTYIERTKFDKFAGAGAVVIRTGISITASIQDVVITIPYLLINSARYSGEVIFYFRFLSSAVDRAAYRIEGDYIFTRDVRYANDAGELVIIIGSTADAAYDISASFSVKSNNPLDILTTSYGVSKETSLSAYTPLSVTGIAPAFVTGVTQEIASSNVSRTAFTLYNSGNSSGSSTTAIQFNMIPNSRTPPSSFGFTQSKGVAFKAIPIGVPSLWGIAFATPVATSDDPTNRMIIDNTGRVGIGTALPSYLLDLTASGAAARFTPHDVTLTGVEGLLYADLSEKTFKGHNGTSFFRFMQQSTTIPTNGQIPVWNSTTGLYEPVTATPAQTPAPSSTADSIGSAGDIRYDDDYIYIKTSAGWKRSALSTF